MSSVFHYTMKLSYADIAGYAVSAASLAMVVYILIERWLW